MTPTLRQLATAPWAITEEMAPAIADILEFRLSGVALSAEEVAARIGGGRSADVGATGGAIAVIPITGVITPDAEEWFNGTAPAAIGRALEAAVANSAVSAIVLAIDSPGGSVYGVPELAEQIAAAAKQKRVVAVATGMMASAAYWLGVAAGEVVATPSGQVGSIGVYTMHVDVSRALDNAGVKVSLVKAGKFKAEGSPFAPLSDEARGALQASVDDYYEQFVGAVARHRGVTMAAVKNGFGEGRVENARPALAKGMVDRIDTLAGVLDDLTGVRRREHMRAAAAGPPATSTAGPPATVLTIYSTAASTGGRAVSAPDPAASATEPAAATGAGDAPAAGLSTTPATSARSATVPENTSAATNAAAAGDNDLARAREAKLRKLARTHQKDVAWLDAAIESGKSIEAIQEDLLDERVGASDAHAVPAPDGNPRPARGDVRVGRDRAADRPWGRPDGKGNYVGGFGEFLGAVANFATQHAYDARLGDLTPFAATGGSQGVPSEGGFLVAPQFSREIWDRMALAPNNLLAQTDSYPIEGESITFNADAETSRADGSRAGGIRGYWHNEAASMTGSKPTFRQARVEPQELHVLVYLTNKLLRNAPTLEPYVARKAAEEINFLVGNAIYRGTGAGQPKGLMTSGSLVSVAKETNQAAATINQKNVSKMWKRLHPAFRANAVWLHNVDVEDQLDNLSTTVMNVAGTENVGGYANKVFDPERRTLKGRPLVACEFSETLGTQGDLMLVDLKQYLTGVQSGGIASDMSMHVAFLTNETAFRFTFAVDGQPWLASPLTPFKGSSTLTSHVVLDTRS